MKPLIGISCSLWAQKKEWVHQEGRTFDHLKREYYQMVEAAGGLPVLLPNVDRPETAGELVGLVDGLILSGGDDVDPAFYGEPNRYPDSVIHPHRDAVEIAFVRRAREQKIPLLGICRGIQLLNVALGGSLHQDTSFRPGTAPHSSHEPFVYLRHPVAITAGTRLAVLAGRLDIEVNSSHHQHVNRVAPGFRVAAVAPDRSVEAIESTADGEYVLGVQWHPEGMPLDPLSRALFHDLLAASAERRRRS